MANIVFIKDNLSERKFFVLDKTKLEKMWFEILEDFNWFFTKNEVINIYNVVDKEELVWFYFIFYNRNKLNKWFYPIYKSKDLIKDILLMFNDLKIDLKTLNINW